MARLQRLGELAQEKGTTLTYMLTDYPSITSGHRLGSTSLITNTTGRVISETRYSAWGEVRYQGGVTPTNYSFTGQASYVTDFGLLFYNSRFYDPQLGRFSSPDSIIPESQGAQAWDRYAYANNNPLKYNDPTGHWVNIVIGAAVGAVVGAGLYIYSESQQSGGFNIKEDWGDLLVASGTMAVAGAFIATPGLQAMGAGMVGRLAADHAEDIILQENFSAVDNMTSGVIGASSGYYGALTTAGMSLAPAITTTYSNRCYYAYSNEKYGEPFFWHQLLGY